MEKIEFFDHIIDTVKKVAKPGDLPMAWFKAIDGKVICSAMAVGKSAMKLSLYTLMRMHQCKEIVLVLEACCVAKPNVKSLKNAQDQQVEVSKDPNRKDCFVICYFSPERECMHQITFTKKKKGKKEICEWGEESPYWETKDCQSAFNPYKMSNEDIEKYAIDTDIEIIKTNGKQEVHELLFGCKFIIYRYQGKAYFECLKSTGEPFMQIKPVKDDAKFNNDVKQALSMLDQAGGML